MPDPFAILKITRAERTQPFAATAEFIGSCFLVAPTLIVTCHHVLTEAFHSEHKTSIKCVVAALTGEAFPLSMDNTIRDPDHDLALINLPELASFNFPYFELATKAPVPNQKCVVRGYRPSSYIPGCAARGIHFGKQWHFDVKEIAVSYESSVSNIKHTTHTRICSEGDSIKGISGAPLIDVDTGLVVGVHAAGCPIKQETCAIGADEVRTLIISAPMHS